MTEHADRAKVKLRSDPIPRGIQLATAHALVEIGEQLRAANLIAYLAVQPPHPDVTRKHVMDEIDRIVLDLPPRA